MPRRYFPWLFHIWQRGGFPRSFLAQTDIESLAWRKNFIQTFLERDLPQWGIIAPPVANGLFALFLFDRWLDGGSRGLFGDPGEKQDAFDEDGQDDWEDREDEDDYWDNQAGF